MMRCRSTSGATARTWSQVTLYSPAMAARALAPSTRYCTARVPAPQLTYSLVKPGAISSSGRDDRARLTAYMPTWSLIGSLRTICCKLDDLRRR